MPNPSKHLSLAAEYVNAAQRLATPEMCRPMSLCAYYAGMHMLMSAVFIGSFFVDVICGRGKLPVKESLCNTLRLKFAT